MLRVDVWSDIACPWCYVGKRHLEAAMERLGTPVEVVWHAFELDPAAERDPAAAPYVERLAKKYGASTEEAQGMIDRMTETGAGVGLELRFDRVSPTNTFDAHRLLALAGQAGLQSDLKERLLAAYMTEGKHLGDRAVLAELATEVGLERDEVMEVLETDRFADEVRADERSAQDIGVSGVPFFVLGRKYAVAGAQPAEVLLEGLEKVRAEGETSG